MAKKMLCPSRVSERKPQVAHLMTPCGNNVELEVHSVSSGTSYNILMCSLSPTPKSVIYAYQGAEVEAGQCPIALIKLLPEEEIPHELIILCTKEIRNKALPETEALMNEIYKNRGLEKPLIMELDIPDGKTQEELWQAMDRILNAALNAGARAKPTSSPRLYLDVTHGFRALPFVWFTAILYLIALERDKLSIEKVFYGMLPMGSNRGPILDLSVVLNLVEWFYAVRTFTDTGQAHWLSEMLKATERPPRDHVVRDNSEYGTIKSLRRSLDEVSAAFAQGLPLELGVHSAKAAGILQSSLPQVLIEQVPMAENLRQILREYLTPLARTSRVAGSRLEKKDMFLTKEELRRQARVVDSYLALGQVDKALGVIREWMVSVVTWYYERGDQGEAPIEAPVWLDYKNMREKIENCLRDLDHSYRKTNKIHRSRLFSEPESWLARTWNFFSSERNHLYHCGYNDENCTVKNEKLRNMRQRWEDAKGKLDKPEFWKPLLLESKK